MGEALNSRQKSIIDRCVRLLYQEVKEECMRNRGRQEGEAKVSFGVLPVIKESAPFLTLLDTAIKGSKSAQKLCLVVLFLIIYYINEENRHGKLYSGKWNGKMQK